MVSINRFFAVIALCLVTACTATAGNEQVNTAATKPVLIPQPFRISLKQGSFQINKNTAIASADTDAHAPLYLQSELERIYQTKCPIVKHDQQSSVKNLIILQLDAKKSGGEGYQLKISNDRIVLTASTDAGIFYGIQTIKQLLYRDKSGLAAYNCEIYDTPRLPMRGVYLNIRSIDRSQDSIAKMKNLINSFAGFKLNTLYIEIADNVIYDRQQFPVNSSRALTKAQLIELVDYAKSLHFEVIPYLQLLSHAVWIMSNPQNVELLEGSSSQGWATAWCPSNPATKAFEKDILEETIEIFRPRYFHIGMDEVNYGPFAECSRCKDKDPSGLFYQSIMDAYNILAKHDVRTVMWHDTLLPSGQYMTGTSDKAKGWQIVDRLPKDIIIADWDYGFYGKSSRTQHEYFLKKGFKVAGASFCSPTGIQTFAKGLERKSDNYGLFNTYWYLAGTWTNPKSVAPEAWMGTLMTAQYAWNTASPKLSEITYDPVYEIAKTLKPIEETNRTWQQIDVSKYFNYCLSNKADSWPSYGSKNTLEQVLNKRIVSRQTVFETSKDLAGKNIILLSAEDNDGLPQGPVNISINRYASKLAFLLSCNVPLEKDSLSNWSRATDTPMVGNISIKYTDGTVSELPLLYRWNIVDWNYKVGVFNGQIAYSGLTKKGNRVQLIRTDWENPHPEKLIRNIDINTSNMDGMSLAVFSISYESGLDK